MSNKIELAFTLSKELSNVLSKLPYDTSSIEIEIEVPKDKTHGDFASNIAMKMARVARKAPRMIAEEIVSLFDKESAHVEKIEIAGAGFINFTIDIDYILSVVNIVNKFDSNYGTLPLDEENTVCLEYVSANPTGYLHVGHGRGAAYGDSLARIMRKAGVNVSREHYVNDAGNQIINMARSVYERYKELYGLD